MIYPRRCPICNNIIVNGTEACNECSENLVRIVQPTCFKCGKPVINSEIEYCFDCEKIPKLYIKGFPTFVYTDSIRNSLMEYKYNNKREYTTFYVKEMLDTYKEQFMAIGFDAIIPVPIHKSKKRIRGYNQAELIARELSKAINIPIITNVVVRGEKTLPQKELNDKERVKNLKRAFKIEANKVKLDKVLLVDDIYTSGATIQAITYLLQAKGVSEVYYTSICIGEGR